MKQRKYIGGISPEWKKVRGRSDQEDIAIRPAESMDYGFIRAPSKETFSFCSDYEGMMPQWFVNPDVMTIVSFEKMQSRGFAMLYVLTGEILAIAVKPEYQGIPEFFQSIYNFMRRDIAYCKIVPKYYMDFLFHHGRFILVFLEQREP